MTEYWSGSITFTGLGSGVDFDSIIESTMEVASYRLNQLESWETQWEAKLELVSDINAKLISYESSLEDMDTIGEFLVKAAVSSDSAVLGVSADADAQEGAHSIVIDQRAQNDIWSTSYGWSSSDDVVTASDATFSVTYGSETLELSVPAGTTLEGLVNRINNDTEMGASIRANLINDGEELHLQIRGLDLGADNTVTVNDSGMTGLDAADFDQTQEAQNARIKVDGYPPGADDWIERDTNSIDDVIEGVTLNLYGTSGGESLDVTVSTDIDAVIANVEAFLEATNAIREAIAALDEDTATDDDDDDVTTTFTTVRGNYGMDIVEQTLQDILVEKGLGFCYYDSGTAQGDLYASFASIGITTDADEDSTTFGQLVLDEDTLREALEADPDSVARLFSAENDGISYSGDFHYESSIESITEPGEYEVEYTISGGAIVSAVINGHTASVDGWQVTGQNGQSEAGLVVEADNRSDGTYSGTVYVRQGKVNQTLDALEEMLDSESGILNIIEDSYQEIIDNTADAILAEEARLELKYQNLVERYANLESLLGYYDEVNTSLETQLEELDS